MFFWRNQSILSCSLLENLKKKKQPSTHKPCCWSVKDIWCECLGWFFLRCPVYPPTLPTYCRKVAIPGQCCPKLSCDIPGTNGSYVPPSEVQVCTFCLSVVGENLNELLHVVFFFYKVPFFFFSKNLQFYLICKTFSAKKILLFFLYSNQFKNLNMY